MARRRGSKKGHTAGRPASRMRAGESGSSTPGGNGAPSAPIQHDVPLPVQPQVAITDTPPSRDHRSRNEGHRHRHAGSSQNRGDFNGYGAIFPPAPPPNMWERRNMNRFEEAQQYGNPYPQNTPPFPLPPFIPPPYPHPPYVQPPYPYPPHVPLPFPPPPHVMPFFPPFDPNHGPISFPQNHGPNAVMVQDGPVGFPLPEQRMGPPNSTTAMGAPRLGPGFDAALSPNKRVRFLGVEEHVVENFGLYNKNKYSTPSNCGKYKGNRSRHSTTPQERGDTVYPRNIPNGHKPQSKPPDAARR